MRWIHAMCARGACLLACTGNDLGAAGATSLAPALAMMPQLMSLSLYGTLIRV